MNLLKDTLVLNESMIPVSFTSRYRAITMVWTDRAEVVCFDTEEFLHSEKEIISVPRVIRLRSTFFKKSKRRIPFSRRNVVVRDSIHGRGQCQYCLKILIPKEITFDHIRPKSKGGVSNWSNLVVCCSVCNKRKSNYTAEECGMHVFRIPAEPSIHDKRYNYRLTTDAPRVEWEPWIDYLHITW